MTETGADPMTTTTPAASRDYYDDVADLPDPGLEPDAEPDADGRVPMTCVDCGRPSYYDSADERYHHAEDAARQCFLIPSEPDRPDDPAHPLACPVCAASAVVGPERSAFHAAHTAQAQPGDCPTCGETDFFHADECPLGDPDRP